MYWAGGIRISSTAQQWQVSREYNLIHPKVEIRLIANLEKRAKSGDQILVDKEQKWWEEFLNTRILNINWMSTFIF